MADYLKELENQKNKILSEIENLKKELAVIERLIFSKKAETSAVAQSEKLNKKNINRIYFEGLILEIISKSARGFKTSEVEKALKQRGHILNPNTVRAYVIGLRDKKKINKKGKYWRQLGGNIFD